MFTYALVSKAQIQIGDPVNISWTAAFFPITGQYNVYHTYKVNKTIFQLQNEGILYGGHNVSNKYRYITRPYNSVNISFEIRDTTVDDAGYYAGGPTADSAWSGGEVVLIVSGKLFFFYCSWVTLNKVQMSFSDHMLSVVSQPSSASIFHFQSNLNQTCYQNYGRNSFQMKITTKQ